MYIKLQLEKVNKLKIIPTNPDITIYSFKIVLTVKMLQRLYIITRKITFIYTIGNTRLVFQHYDKTNAKI